MAALPHGSPCSIAPSARCEVPDSARGLGVSTGVPVPQPARLPWLCVPDARWSSHSACPFQSSFPPLHLERGGIPLGVSLHAAGLRQGMPCAVLQPCSCQHEESVSQASGPGCTRGWSWPGCAAGKWLWLGTQTRLLPGLGAAIPNGSTRDHSAITVTGQTDSTWGKLIYSQLKQMRNRDKIKKTPSPLPLFPGSTSVLPSWLLYLPFLSGAGG